MLTINKELLNKMVAEGFVYENKHPEFDLYIYNYSRKCTYEKEWNEVTLLCRGLVLDVDKNIVSLPLPKFFNYEEWGTERINSELRGRNWKIYEKADGSCGILVEHKGNYMINTRGSFDSEQAKWATKLLNTNKDYLEAVKKLDTDKYTYVFEIIYGNGNDITEIEVALDNGDVLKYKEYDVIVTKNRGKIFAKDISENDEI